MKPTHMTPKNHSIHYIVLLSISHFIFPLSSIFNGNSSIIAYLAPKLFVDIIIVAAFILMKKREKINISERFIYALFSLKVILYVFSFSFLR